MKQMSFWAAANIPAARILLVGCHLLKAALALATGSMLYRMGVTVPGILLWLAAGGAAIAAVLYPRKSKPGYRQLYARRKRCDFILAMCGFLMMLSWAGEVPLLQTTGAAHATALKSEAGYMENGNAHVDGRVGRLMQKAGRKAHRLFHWLDDVFRKNRSGFRFCKSH